MHATTLRSVGSLENTGSLESADRTFDHRFDQLCTKTVARWWRTPQHLPNFGARFSHWRQWRNQRQTDHFADSLEAELLAYPIDEDTAAEQQAWRDRLREQLRQFGGTVMALPADQHAVIFSDAYFDATARFAREARAFDPELQIHDLSQALRNVWIMHLGQLLLGRELKFTRPIFAYSLLYPYTDNFLDDPELGTEAKRRFCERLERRLAGERLLPTSPHERSVFRLVGLIEETLPRRDFGDVYRSLLAIHQAQTCSLRQDAGALCEARILALSVAKGGASVLADGYLVAGDLNAEEVELFFTYGVFLQLADDLQDITGDLHDGHQTLFSRQALRGPLDGLTNRLVHFLDDVLASERFTSPHCRVLGSLIRNSCVQLIVQSAAHQPQHFSRRYLNVLQAHALTRFAYLRRNHRSLIRRYRLINERLSRGTMMDSLFEALG